MYPTKEEFEEILRSRDLDRVLEDYVLTGLPFSFADRPDLYQRMLKELTRGLGVPEQDICVVGSARIGFSLSPANFGAPFNEHSDIDIVVVSPSLFDPSWVDILTGRRVRWASVRWRTREGMREHREKDHIYNGWMYPNLVAEALGIGERWVTTFDRLARIPDLASISIGGRLYRTWDHVKIYHMRGLRRIRETIDRPSAVGA